MFQPSRQVSALQVAFTTYTEIHMVLITWKKCLSVIETAQNFDLLCRCLSSQIIISLRKHLTNNILRNVITALHAMWNCLMCTVWSRK